MWRAAASPRRLARAALLALAVAGPVLPLPAAAERADRERPLQIEADRLDYDDLNRVNVFSGRVALTKGSLSIRADRVVVSEDADGWQHAVATGKPATLRQRRDGPTEAWVEGQGERIEWDGRTEVVRFLQRAQLRRLEASRVTDEVQGARIRYDTRSETYDVESGSSSAGPDNPGGRVRVIIQPRAADAARPGTSAPARAPGGTEATPLRPAERLGTPRDPAAR